MWRGALGSSGRLFFVDPSLKCDDGKGNPGRHKTLRTVLRRFTGGGNLCHVDTKYVGVTLNSFFSFCGVQHNRQGDQPTAVQRNEGFVPHTLPYPSPPQGMRQPPNDVPSPLSLQPRSKYCTQARLIHEKAPSPTFKKCQQSHNPHTRNTQRTKTTSMKHTHTSVLI